MANSKDIPMPQITVYNENERENKRCNFIENLSGKLRHVPYPHTVMPHVKRIKMIWNIYYLYIPLQY